MTPTILILGISGNVSAGILKVIRSNFKKAFLIGACVSDTFNAIYTDKFILSPYADDPSFFDWLVEISNIFKVDIILSGVEEVNEYMSQNKQQIFDYCNSKVISPSFDAIKIGKDKYKTASWLRDNNLFYPQTELLSSKKDIYTFFNKNRSKLILKPKSGKGSVGVYSISTMKEIEDLNIDFSQYVVQEAIGNNNDEFTVGCFQFQNGHCVNPIIMNRRLSNGNTVYTRIVENYEISSYCLDIIKKLNPLGPLNVQLRLDYNGKPVCFELNVRFSGTTLIRDHFGFKDVVASIYEALNILPKKNMFNFRKKGICFRQLEEHFFESDVVALDCRKLYKL